MKNKIYFRPASQIENTGDLLINKAEVDLLRTYGDIIIDNSNTPDWFIDQISIKEKDSRLTEKSKESLFNTVFKTLKQKTKDETVYLVIQPGHTSRKGRKIAINSFKEFLKFYILKLRGCKIIRTGFSIGPFDKANAWLESLYSRAYHHYAVRDQESLKLSQKYNFKSSTYSPDLAWAYRVNPENLRSKEELIVLSFRSNPHGTVHNEEYLFPIVEKLYELLKHVLTENTKIVVAYQVKYDRDASIYIFNKLSDFFTNIELIDEKLLLDSAESLYSRANYVISNRLHVLLLAFQANTLAIPFVYDIDNKKITSIYNDNGFGNLILYTDENIESLVKKLKSFEGNSQQILDNFNSLAIKNKDLIISSLDTVFKDKTNT